VFSYRLIVIFFFVFFLFFAFVFKRNLAIKEGGGGKGVIVETKSVIFIVGHTLLNINLLGMFNTVVIFQITSGSIK
jgi:hypothetical protein